MSETYATKTELGEAVDNRVVVGGEFLYRTTGGEQDVPSGRATVQSIKGNTLVWNQLVQNGNFESISNWGVGNCSISASDNELTMVGGEASETPYIQQTITATANSDHHKLLYAAEAYLQESGNIVLWSNQNAVRLDNATPSTWLHIAGITSNNQQDSRFRIYVNYSESNFNKVTKIKNVMVFDLTQMFGAGNEPATVTEFEALFSESYYPYDAGSLLPVHTEGIETVGFNLWDEQWEVGGIYSDSGRNSNGATNHQRSKNYIPVFPSTTYYIKCPNQMNLCFYDYNKSYLGLAKIQYKKNQTFVTAANAYYMRFVDNAANGWVGYNNDICINLSDPARNGTYEPYWRSERAIPVATYFPDGMWGFGSYRDALYADRAEHNVGKGILAIGDGVTFSAAEAPNEAGLYSHTLQYTTAAWNESGLDRVPTISSGTYLHTDQAYSTLGISDSANFAASTSAGIQVLKTNRRVYLRWPTLLTETEFTQLVSGANSVLLFNLGTQATTIDPPLNLTYKMDSNGTERVLVDETQDAPQSAPLPMNVTYGVNLYESAGDDAASMASIESRVTTAESAITQNANNIALKVSETDVTGNYIVGKINLDSTTASIAAQHINLQGAVTISDLSSDAQNATLNSNISVGGRNLLPTANVWENGTWNSSTGVHSASTTRIRSTSDGWYVSIEPNETYVLDRHATVGSDNVYHAVLYAYDSNGTFVPSDSVIAWITTFPYVYSPKIATRLEVGIKHSTDSSIGISEASIARFKLEKGNIATDWTPAPEDMPDQMTWYGTCSTAASTAEKAVACDGFELQTGARIAVKSTYINTVNAPTLNVNGTGAIATWYNNAVSSTTNPIRWGANATLNFIYDGSVWVLDERPPSYSATCSTAASTRSKAPSVVGALVVNGTRLSVRFSTANTYVDNSVQLNLASTGAYSVYQNNAVTSTTNTLLWDANTILTFVAQGTYWHLLSRSDASETATSYVTEITGQNGIMVHPSTDQTTGVQITSDVDILRGGTSVAEYGEMVRIGAESSDHVEIDSNELMFHDGTNAVMQVGGSCQITEKHVCGSSFSEVFYLSLKPSNGATFRVIDKNSEIVTSNYTLSRSGKRCTFTNKSGTALDGETVLVFYQSSGMVLYDEGDVSSTFTTDQASLAGGMFELSYKDTYSSIDGTLTDSTAEISISERRDQYSLITLNTMPNYNRAYMTFQAVRNGGFSGFVLDSGSTDEPTRSLDLIYLDEIRYIDPYSNYRTLGKPVTRDASTTLTIDTVNTWIDGPTVYLDKGYWCVVTCACFNTGSSSGTRKLRTQIRRNTMVWAEGSEIIAASNAFGRVQAVAIMGIDTDSTPVTAVVSSTMTFTTASSVYITAVQLA